MADPLRPNPFRPVRNLAAREASGQLRPDQPRPAQPQKCRKVKVDKQLPTATRHHDSTTPYPKDLKDLKDLKSHNITTEKSTIYPGHFKSHSSSGRTESNTHSRTSLSPSGQASPGCSRTVFRETTIRETTVNGRTSSFASGQTDPGGPRTVFRETTIRETTVSGGELPTRSGPSEADSFVKMEQEMEQRVNQGRADWQAKREASGKEFFSGAAQPLVARPLKKEPGLFVERLSRLTLDQPSTPGSDRHLAESKLNSQRRTFQSTYHVRHTPENVVSTLETIVDKCIKCAIINVGEGLERLRAALADVHKELSWGVASTWSAGQALRNSQENLDTLARQYRADNLASLTTADIPEFRKKVKHCVRDFMEAAKAIKADRGKIVKLEAGITTFSKDVSRRPHLT